MFMTILDSTIVNVALPTLGREFSVATSASEWVITSYLISLAIFIPASGWIGDRLGTKRTFLFALAVFTGASVLCGLANSLAEMIVFRVIEGIGGGMLIPVGLAMLYRAFPPERRAAASKILIIPTAVAPASGPILGGFLIDDVSWRWVFLINVPIGIAAFLFGWTLLEEHREPAEGGFDLAGFILGAGGLSLAMLALSEGPVIGWATPLVLGSAVVGLAALALLVVVEGRVRYPLLELRLLRNRLFRTTNLSSAFAYAAFLGTLFIVPLLLQDARGASPLSSGLTSFPEAIGVISVSQIAARLYHRIGPSRLMSIGMVLMSATLAAMSRIGGGTNEWFIRLGMYCLGASFSFMLMAVQIASFATISPADTGEASALYNTQRQVSSALGVAILASALTIFLPAHHATSAQTFSAYHKVFLVAAAIAVVGAFASTTVPDADAAATGIRPRRNAPQPSTA
jgi:EmrB/QacA subfamily drug resistance transporter